MKTLWVCSLIVAVWVTAWALHRAPAPVRDSDIPVPLLVELFTSEACSSCPPADRLLEKLDKEVVPGAQLIVLSEHVDYWNQAGWKDPYSAASFSVRQSAYARRFALDEVYTPQMVVDGSYQFVGSDSGRAAEVFKKALNARKLPVRLSLSPADGADALHVHLETGILEPFYGAQNADVYLTVALSRANSEVSSGENAGHRLNHVSVARALDKVAVLTKGNSLANDMQIKLEPGSDLHNLRVIAFVQEAGQGRVLGAAMLPVTAP